MVREKMKPSTPALKMKPSKPSNPLTPAQQKTTKRGPTNPNRPGGIKLGSSRINPNSPGGVLKSPKATNTSAKTRAKVADLKKQIKKLMGQYK